MTSSDEGVYDPRLTLNTASSKSNGPTLILNHEGSDANNDTIGMINFECMQSDNSSRQMASISSQVIERNVSSKASDIRFTINSGNSTIYPISMTGS